MSKGIRTVLIVFGAIAAGWCGYWLGHLFGWSEDADWPTSVGGGAAAILLSIGCALVAALLLGRLLVHQPNEKRSRQPSPASHVDRRQHPSDPEVGGRTGAPQPSSGN